MANIIFSDWTPDAARLGGPGNITATNAVPAAQGYQPFQLLSVISTALDARPRGAIEAYDSQNVSYQYAGNETKLYSFNADTLAWADVSIGGGYATGTDEIWNFARWKNKILAVNFSNNPQQITMGAALFSNLTTALRARNIAVVGDFVVMSNTYDGSDGNVPNRVRWSAIDDETDWTVSASTLSDYRDLPTGGPVRKVVGGEVGIVVSERSVYRMSYVGAPAVFQMDEILPDIGALSSGAVTNIGESVYFVSQQGFIELTGNGSGINRIGAGRVDKTFLNDLDPDYYHRITSIADPTSNRILWGYPGAGNTGGRPNKIILYDRTFNKWALIEEEVELLLKSKGVSLTLDELDGLGYTDIDVMDVSLDSDTFKRSASQIAAFDEDFKLGFFRGLNKTATLETAELELNPGAQTHLSYFIPLVDAGTVTARVAYRNRQSDSATYSGSYSQSTQGRFDTRINARFMRMELTVSGETWRDAIGIQIDSGGAKRAGGRGRVS